MLINFKKIKKFITTYAKKILGGLLVIGGIIGLFLPFLQGLLMIGAGLILLGNHSLVVKLRHYGQKLTVFWRRCLAWLRIKRK